MKPLAVLKTRRPNGRVASRSGDRVRARSLGQGVDGREFDPASQAFGGCDAKDVNGGLHHDRAGNLKPNIYYKPQDFAGMVEDGTCDC
jgi:hypothetical protein